MLNLSAAFDTVDQAILYIGDWKSVLAKRYGLEWFSSHLTGRSQQVSGNNVIAMYVSPDYGLPQGSVLSPVMYLLYTSYRVELVRWFCLLTHVYVDDLQYIVIWIFVLIRLCWNDLVNVLILLVGGCPQIDSSFTHHKRNWFDFAVALVNLVLLRMTLCFSAIVLFLSTLSDGYWVMLDSNMIMYQPVRTVISNFSWSVVWGGSSLLNQNFSWCMNSFIISWITIILAFLRVFLGLLYSCYTATVWVELCCSFDFWFEIIWLRYSRPDVVALAPIYAKRTTYKFCMIICLNASVHGSFRSCLFKLTIIALVCGAWSIGFWDLLFMVTLL